MRWNGLKSDLNRLLKHTFRGGDKFSKNNVTNQRKL